jgi:hypothetical protein
MRADLVGSSCRAVKATKYPRSAIGRSPSGTVVSFVLASSIVLCGATVSHAFSPAAATVLIAAAATGTGQDGRTGVGRTGNDGRRSEDPSFERFPSEEEEEVGPPDYSVDLSEMQEEVPPDIPDLDPAEEEAIRREFEVRIRDGEVLWSPADVEKGAIEFSRLSEAGDIDLELLSILGDEDQQKVRALLVSSAYAIARALATYCARVPRDEFTDRLGKALAVLGANIVNSHNANGDPFTVYAPSGSPWYFGIADLTLGKTGSGKGVIQDIIESVTTSALPVERPIDFSVVGFFGGHDAAVRGRPAERVDGAVERARRGIILIPEGDTLADECQKNRKFGALLAELLSSGRVNRDLGKGRVGYRAWPSIHIALQPEAYSTFTTSVARVERRVLLSEILPKRLEEEAEEVTRLENATPFDRAALFAVRSILKNRVRSFAPTKVLVGRVTTWLGGAMLKSPVKGVRFGRQDAQRIVAVAVGLYLMKHVGPIPDTVVIPSPADDPDLLRIVTNDARLRAKLSLPEEDARESDIVRALKTDPAFLGTPERPFAYPAKRWIEQIVHLTGRAPSTIGFAFYGGKDRRGVYHPSLVEQNVLDEAPAPEFLADSARATEIAARIAKGSATQAEREERDELNRRAGRPALQPPKHFVWNFARSASWEDGP